MHSRTKSSSKGKVFMYVLLGVFVLAAVGIAVFSTVNIAGDTVVGLAVKAVREQTGMLMSVREVKGNPIRGYTFGDITLTSEKGQRLFSAQTLGVNINFMSLLRADPRLSHLAIGGVDMDLDKFIAELKNIKLQESSGGGEVPIDRISLQNSRFTSQWGEIDVTEIGARLQGTLMDVNIAGAVNGVPVKGTFDTNIQGQNASINKVELDIGKARLNSSGSVRPGSESDGATALDFQGSLKGLNLREITAFWPEFLAPDDYDGTADIDFSIEGAGSNLLISAALDYKGTRLGGYPVEALAGQFKYANMRLSADNVKASSLGIPIEGSFAMAMATGGVPSIMVKLDGSNAPLSELAKLYPALGKVDGKIEHFTVNIQGPSNALSGTIELSAPDFVLIGKRLTGLAMQIKLAQSDTATVNGKFALEGAQAYVQGSIAKILTGANLNLTAKLLDLDIRKIENLIPDGKKFALAGALTANLAIQGKASAPSISGTLSSPKFTVMGYTLDKPSLTFAYDKEQFTLKESSGSWSGLPIKVNGTVGPLSSKTPAINMTAQLAFKPENLKQFVPDIANYNLQGNINAGVKITGKLPEPKIDLVVSSPALSAFNAVSLKNLEVTSAIAGDLAKLDKIALDLKASSVVAGGVGLQNLNASIKKDGQQIKLESVSARSGSGSLSGGGTLALGGKDATLNLAFDLNQLDLTPLAKSGGLAVPLAGILTGKVAVTGVSSNPAVSFSGQAPSIAVDGFTLMNLVADLSGNMTALKVNTLKAEIGGAPLSASGNIELGTPFKADIDIVGSNLDLAALTAGIPDLKGQLSGKVDLKFKVVGTAKGNSGTGSIASPAIGAYGLKLVNVAIPLTLEGSSLKSTNGTLDFYGGKVTNSFSVDLGSMKFSNTLNANDFDVNAVAQDASGGMGGKITGKGVLSLKIEGSAAKDLTYSGSGQFSMGEGGISGFSGLDLVTKLYGLNAIRYTKVVAPLQLQMNKLILVKGGTATAPVNDPIYKYVKLAENGTVTFDKKLYFVVDGNVNFQLINALSGGALGGADALLKGGKVQDILSGKNLESILKGAVQGGREQGKDADFRDITAKVTGTFDKPSVSLVKVGPSSLKQEGDTGTAASADAAAKPSQPAKTEDIIKEKILDAIIPQKKPEPKQPEVQNEAPSTSQEQSAPTAPKEEPKNVPVEKQIEEQIIKGIDSLFKKK